MVLTLLFTIPLFVSENVRLYGWVLFLIKNGVLLGTLKSLFGIELSSMLFTLPAIILGMVYVYLPFMLFPMTASRWCRTKRGRQPTTLGPRAGRFSARSSCRLPCRELSLDLLLTFVLAVGAIAEAKVMGGQRIIPIVHDIEIAFTYAQNWPLGSALAVLLMFVVAFLVILVLRRFDLDQIMGKR